MRAERGAGAFRLRAGTQSREDNPLAGGFRNDDSVRREAVVRVRQERLLNEATLESSNPPPRSALQCSPRSGRGEERGKVRCLDRNGEIYGLLIARRHYWPFAGGGGNANIYS